MGLRKNTDGNLRESGVNVKPSMSEIEVNKKTAENNKGEARLREVTMVELMKYYSPKYLVAVSFIVTFIAGFGYPAHGYLFFEILFQFFNFTDTDYWFYINLFCGMFLVTGFGIGMTQFLQRYSFSALGENLTCTIRVKLFESIMYKHVAWFDHKDKAPGVLSNILSEDIVLLNGLSTETVAIIFEAVFTVVVGLIVALCFCW